MADKLGLTYEQEDLIHEPRCKCQNCKRVLPKEEVYDGICMDCMDSGIYPYDDSEE